MTECEKLAWAMVALKIISSTDNLKDYQYRAIARDALVHIKDEDTPKPKTIGYSMND